MLAGGSVIDHKDFITVLIPVTTVYNITLSVEELPGGKEVVFDLESEWSKARGSTTKWRDGSTGPDVKGKLPFCTHTSLLGYFDRMFYDAVRTGSFTASLENTYKELCVSKHPFDVKDGTVVEVWLHHMDQSVGAFYHEKTGRLRKTRGCLDGLHDLRKAIRDNIHHIEDAFSRSRIPTDCVT